VSDSPKVLIVDDETSILDTLRILLKREGFDVHTAVGGQQGLDALREGQPDFVLSDIRMPGVTGIECSTPRADGSDAPRNPDDRTGVASVGDPGGEPGSLLLHPEAVLRTMSCW
jgi:CheY-like chemotaxis protein